MASVSLNPRYVFTSDRIPAVIVYSFAAALAAIVGLLAHGMFEQAGWFINIKDHVGGPSLFVDLSSVLVKFLAALAAVYFVSLFAKRALQDQF